MLERVINGSSGAVIQVHDLDVSKMGGDVVLRQGMWLDSHRCLALPRTLRKAWPDGGYVMEKLDELPRPLIDGRRMAVSMISQLRLFVWDRPGQAVLDVDAHRALALDSLASSYLDKQGRALLVKWFDRIQWDRQEQTLTHGNCDYHSVMIRRGSDVVFTDPIPANTQVPSLKVSDVGHILKSALGYDEVVYGPENALRASDQLVLNQSNIRFPSHVDAAYYWAVVHMLRALPHLTSDQSDELIELVDSTIREHVA